MKHPVMGFEHLHRHSDFSLLDGLGQVSEYAQRSKEINMNYLCITDHGVMGAVPQQISESEEHGLFPIFGCLTAGQGIYTIDGVKNVENVQIGDMVLTHLGRYRKVTKVMSRKHSGKLYSVYLGQCRKLHMKITGEHPVLIRNINGERSWIRVDQIQSGRPTTECGIYHHNSYVCFPKSVDLHSTTINSADYLPDEIDLSEGFAAKHYEGRKSCYWRNIAVNIQLTENLAYFLGLFVAEGSFARKNNTLTGGVRLTFNIKEVNLANFCVNFLANSFGISSKTYTYPIKSTREVCFSCLPMAYILAGMCGIGAKNKKIPNEILQTSDLSARKMFLKGLLCGDGKNPNKSSNTSRARTLKVASRTLAWQFKIMLANQNEWGTVSVCYDNKNRRTHYYVAYYPYRSCARYLFDDKYVYKPIQKIECDEVLDVPVFNFEVEEDHSYVSDFALHNCEVYINRMQFKASCREESSNFRSQLSEEEKKKWDKNRHLLILAYNPIGYRNLVQLTSWAWIHGCSGRPTRPRINWEMLLKHKEGLIITSTCANSEIAAAFFEGGDDQGFDMVEQYMAAFGDKFYLELMMLDFKDQKPYDQFLIRAHNKYGVPVFLSQDCLVAGTLVTTKDGLVPIEQVKFGDFVLTHQNRMREVEITGHRPLKEGEKVYRVKAKLGTYTFEATGNHKIYIANKSDEGIWSYDWKPTENLTSKDYLLVAKTPHEYLFGEGVNVIDLMDFIDSSEYQVGENYNSSPKGNMGCGLQYIKEKQEFVSYRGFDRKFKMTIPRYLPVDDDLLRVMGWYMAEGWSEKGKLQVGFALHQDEQDVADFLIGYFAKFGIIAKTYKVSNNGIAVRMSSKVFNRFLGKLCGQGANNKHLPYIGGTWIKKWSKEQILKILFPYWLEDGSGNRKSLCFSSTSKVAIYEVATILNSFGFCCMPRVEFMSKKNTNWADCWHLVVSGNVKAGVLLDWMNGKQKPEIPNKCYDLGDHFAVPVKSITPIEYDGLVYDMQVHEDHSFCSNGIRLSNCHYCRKENSHHQRLMLMMKTDRTIQEVQALIASGDADDLFELQDENLWMKSEDELNEKWESDYQGIIDYDLYMIAKQNSVKLCELCKGVELDRTIKLPIINDDKQKLMEAIKRGVVERRIPRTKQYLDRIMEEYSLICEKGFASYFLIMKMMVDEAVMKCPELYGWDQEFGSFAKGPGRGCSFFSQGLYRHGGERCKIIDVKIGDEVMTIDGTFRKVTNTFKYDIDNEDLICIKSYYGDYEGVTMTKDHKVLVEKEQIDPKWVNASEFSKKKIKKFIDPVGNMKWIPMQEISIGDWVYTPIPKIAITETTVDLAEFAVGKFKNGKALYANDTFVYHTFNGKQGKGVQIRCLERHWKLDVNWACILGIWTGDGWICTDQRPTVEFCFHEDQTDSQSFVEKVFNDIGVETKIEYNIQGKKVNKLFAKSIYYKKLFQKLFNEYQYKSATKHVPECIMTASEDIVAAYLHGYFLADGHEDNHKIKFETVSFKLAHQIRYLLLRLGIPSSITKDDRQDSREEFKNKAISYIITCPLDKRIGTRDAEKNYFYHKVEGGILTKVRSIEEVKGVKEVYDIEVEGNHNYLTTSFLVHNSVCGSLVAYCLDLHDVEPIRHGLLFSRFLSPARGGKQMKIRFTIDPFK